MIVWLTLKPQRAGLDGQVTAAKQLEDTIIVSKHYFSLFIEKPLFGAIFT